MRLLIVSHTPHYAAQESYRGWGPTVREIDWLSRLFDHTTHLAILHNNNDKVPASSLPYSSGRISLRLLPPAGGAGIREKVKILTVVPKYIKAICEEMKNAEIVHVRCPANISLLCLLVLIFRSRPVYRWVKYAGNWDRKANRPASYEFQRWLLKHNMHRGVVTINGQWQGTSTHILSFRNPSFSEAEATKAANPGLLKVLEQPIKLLFIGRLEQDKGLETLQDIVQLLNLTRIHYQLDIVGDGPMRKAWREEAHVNGTQPAVRYHGWVRQSDLFEFYAQAHFLLLPSKTEGWPKVISEGMAYGVVPLATGISAIPQYLTEFGCGKAMPPDDAPAYVNAIEGYLDHPDRWKKESLAGIEAAGGFTYEAYLERVKKMAMEHWNLDLVCANDEDDASV